MRTKVSGKIEASVVDVGQERSVSVEGEFETRVGKVLRSKNRVVGKRVHAAHAQNGLIFKGAKLKAEQQVAWPLRLGKMLMQQFAVIF